MNEPIKREGTKVIAVIPPNSYISRLDTIPPRFIVVSPHEPPYILRLDGSREEIKPEQIGA